MGRDVRHRPPDKVEGRIVRDWRVGHMSGPMTWVDETTAWVVLAVPVGEAYDAPRWVEVLRLAEEEAAGDWAACTARVVELAGEQGFDGTAVTAFLEAAEAAGGFTAVTAVVELGDQLPTVLTDLREARQGTEATADDDPLGWVTDAQRGHLEQVWGSAWQEYLHADLDQRWGADWHAHPVEHKLAWLDDLLAAGAYSTQEETADTADDPLGWVTDGQRAHLAAAWGDQWPAALAADLDQRWGADWRTHPVEHKVAGLDDLVAAGTYAAAEPAAEAAAIPDAASEAMADLLASMRAVPGAESLSDEELARIVAETVGKAGS
jgi:hypothetical protein